jgi:hypothetical protein
MRVVQRDRSIVLDPTRVISVTIASDPYSVMCGARLQISSIPYFQRAELNKRVENLWVLLQ